MFDYVFIYTDSRLKDKGEPLLLSFKSMYATTYGMLIWNSCWSLLSCLFSMACHNGILKA